MLWKDVGKHPPLFSVGRLQKQFYIQNELARAMSSDTSELQTDCGKLHRVYRQILPREGKFVTFSKIFEKLDNSAACFRFTLVGDKIVSCYVNELFSAIS